MERRIKLKKKLLTLFLAMLYTFTSTNFIFAVVHHTLYQPYNVETNTFEQWAAQPQGAPWCFDSCMKIVLKDVQAKNPLGGGFNIPNINAIVGAPVPEEEIVHRVLLSNHAIGEIGTINSALEKTRNAFLEQTFHFCDYYLGNRVVHERIRQADVNKRVNVLNGLLGMALNNEMDDLWGHLNANTKKMLVQDSALAVLDQIRQDTNLAGTKRNVDIIHDAAYNAFLNTIVNEIETNNRMVLLIFQSISHPQQLHTCIAYVTVRNDPQLSIAVYNPWGRVFEIRNDNLLRFFDINNEGGPASWYLSEYVTFNY